MPQMRVFVCSFLSAEAQAFYGRRMADLIADSGGLLRGIPPQSAHVTYAFVGRTDDRGLADIIEGVTVAASRHDAIAMQAGAPTIQFARAEARLVSAPVVTGAQLLSQLTMDIVGELQRRLGADAVSGSRSPHVTLARFRRNTHRRSTTAIAEALTRGPLGTAARNDRITHVQVVLSDLTEAAPRYDTQASIPLRGA